MNLNQQLKKNFGHESFRPLQEEIITSVLEGRDTVGILPTGLGKSITFQLPTLILPGLTLVISPLISLMKDQVDQLKSIGIPAAYINSSVKLVAEKRDITRRLVSGEIKILYCSPEKIKNEKFFNFLRSLNISLFVIDEAHCVSLWGNDFRKDYLELYRLRLINPNAPLLALTATATDRIICDIVNHTGMVLEKVFKGSFDRPNLFIEVREKGNIFEDIIKLYGEIHNQGANIIYGISKDEVSNLAHYISGFNRLRGKTDYYHAGRKTKDRIKIQNDFMGGKITDLACTSAFGMGVNKPDVRVVIHSSMPQTLLDYQQQAGRAGRDGKLSKCIIFYDPVDIYRWESIIDQTTAVLKKHTDEEAKAKLDQRDIQYKLLRDMSNFCEQDSECRRKVLLEYFGEYHPGNCMKCDVCLS